MSKKNQRSTQRNTILKAMIDNPDIKWWNAKDFQQGKYFVGYEATARMSELKDIPFIEYRMNDRFRELAINWKMRQDIQDMREIIALQEGE